MDEEFPHPFSFHNHAPRQVYVHGLLVLHALFNLLLWYECGLIMLLILDSISSMPTCTHV